MSPITFPMRDPTTNMTGAAVVFLADSIVLGIARANTYAIVAGSPCSL